MGLGNFAEKLKQLIQGSRGISEDFFEHLEDYLVEGDLGAQESVLVVEKLRLRCKKEGLSDAGEVRQLLARILVEELDPLYKNQGPLLNPEERGIFLILGVNGVGKTTSCAKLAARYQKEGRKVILAAADTFRAGAIDQLKIHGERLHLRVVAHQSGGDPAAVVYDALEAAQAQDAELVIADTAGRMHTKSALVEELKKIDRVIASRAGDWISRKILVLDATTGRNALSQAEVFHQAVHLDGVILSKYDSTARGGVVFSLGRQLSLPILFLGEGERYEDLRPFQLERFVGEFVGLA